MGAWGGPGLGVCLDLVLLSPLRLEATPPTVRATSLWPPAGQGPPGALAILAGAWLRRAWGAGQGGGGARALWANACF